MSRSAALLKRLLPKLHEDLDDELADEEDSYSTKEIVEELCDDALERCAASIAKFKKAHNAGLPHARLPPEIWCIIWSLLDEEWYIIAVSHVCRSWRAMATNYAPFWTDVHFFSTVHASGARCGTGPCECGENRLWAYDEEPRPIHNLHKVKTFLARSKGARISMDIRTYAVFSDHSLADRLAKMVQPHAHRVASIVYTFGDVAFLVKFMQQIKDFGSLRFLRMRRSTYLVGEHNSWPMMKMQLEDLAVPRLREFRGYGDFWWDVPRPPDARSLGALWRLRCNFRDARAFYHCLRFCPNLVFLIAELNDYAVTRVPPAPDDVSALAPRLRDLVLDRMTLAWEAAVLPVIRRPELEILTLRYNRFDAASIFDSLHHLAGDVELSIHDSVGSIDLRAEDRDSRSYWLEFYGLDTPPALAALSLVWNHIPTQQLRSLTVAWIFRSALLSKRLFAPGISRIELVIAYSGPGAPRSVDELMALNDPTVAGRPSFPNLEVLEITTTGKNVILPAASVHDFVAALTDRECAIELENIVLQES